MNWVLSPLAKILSFADAEQAPEWFTTTPSLAVPKAVAKAGLQMSDVDYWELNEAFAVVGIENTRRMKFDPACKCSWGSCFTGTSVRMQWGPDHCHPD